MNAATADRLIELLKTRFFNRNDVAAIAGKKKTPFPIKIKQDTFDALLRTHVLGDKAEPAPCMVVTKKSISVSKGRFRVGSYAPATDGTTMWLCIDIDGPGHANSVAEPGEAALRTLKQFEQHGLAAYLERSGGGQGWHIWVFFEGPFPAERARALAFALIPKNIPLANGKRANPKKGQGVEVFPKQDKIAEDGYGNLVWLPWWSGARDGGNHFYEQNCVDLVPYVPESLTTVTAAQVDQALERAQEQAEIAKIPVIPAALSELTFPEQCKAWRREMLAALSLEQIYGPWLTGKVANGWLECRDPDSPSGDQNPSAGVADGTGQCERGSFHSFISGQTQSVFDFMMARRLALSFRHACDRLGELTGVPFAFNTEGQGQDSDPAEPRSPGASSAARRQALPTITVNKRQLQDVVNDAWESVHRVNKRPDLFTRNDSLVRLRRRGDELVIDDLNEDGTYEFMSRTALWVKVMGESLVESTFPPREVAKAMRAAPCSSLPELESVLACPVFGASGDIIATPGYHPAEKVWYEPAAGLDVPEAPVNPTPEDVAAARALLLEDLGGDFPFVSPSDRAHWLASLILPFVRRMIAGPTPLHFVEAPCNGAGKSLLCDLVSILATGQACNAQTLPIHEDEAAKTITAELLKGQPIILLDNQTERFKLNSPALASALTCQHWTGRLLGQTKMLSLPNNATWMMTGNNPNMSTEIARRCLRIRIDPRQDRAWQRDPGQFRHPDIKGWARDNRGQLISAIHTLVHAWIAAGKPAGRGAMGSFESWASVLGGILGTAGVPGFLECLSEMYRQADTDGEEWREFVQAWWTEFGCSPRKVSELNNLCEQQDLLVGLRGDRGSRSQETRLGNALNAMRDRVFGNLRIASARNAKYAKGGRMYQLVLENDEPPGGSSTENPEASLDLNADEPVEELPNIPQCGPCADLVRTSKHQGTHIRSAVESTTSENSADLCVPLGQSRAYTRARAVNNNIMSVDRARACAHVREAQPAQRSAQVRTEGEAQGLSPVAASTSTSADLGPFSGDQGPHRSAQGTHSGSEGGINGLDGRFEAHEQASGRPVTSGPETTGCLPGLPEGGRCREGTGGNGAGANGTNGSGQAHGTGAKAAGSNGKAKPPAPWIPTEPPPDAGEAWEDPNYVEPTAADGSRIPDPWDPDYDPANDPWGGSEESS